MTPLLTSLKQMEKVDDLEAHINDLIRQKDVLQKIEDYTNDKVDFGDMLETYNLLVEEIERLQEQLKEQKEKSLPIDSGERECVEEEEEELSSSSKYNIEHVVKDGDGKLRSVKPEDLDIESNKGVRDAFKLLYEYQKNRQYEEDEEEGEEEGEPSFGRFDLESQNKEFLDLLRKHVRDKGLEWDRKK